MIIINKILFLHASNIKKIKTQIFDNFNYNKQEKNLEHD